MRNLDPFFSTYIACVFFFYLIREPGIRLDLSRNVFLPSELSECLNYGSANIAIYVLIFVIIDIVKVGR
jgi:hypothetical protein